MIPVFFLFLILERQIGSRVMVPNDWVVSYISVYLFFVFCYRRFRLTPGAMVVPFISGFIVPELVIRILEGFSDSVETMPKLLIEIVAALLATRQHLRGQKLPGLIAAFLLLAGATIYGAQWQHFINYGSLSGPVSELLKDRLIFYRDSGEPFDPASSGDKIMVLDFWNTSCPACFRKFPELQTLYDRYGNNDKVFISAVNVPLDRDSAGSASGILQRKGFRFPSLIAAKEMERTFRIESYPTTVILKNNRIWFRGDITEVPEVLDRMLLMPPDASH